jgi:serine protease Do
MISKLNLKSIGLGVSALACLGFWAAQSHGSSGAPASSDLNIFVDLSKKIVPSVVNISSFSTVKGNPGAQGGSPDDMIRKFFDELFRQQHGGGHRGDAAPDDDDDDSGPTPIPPGGTPDRKNLPRAISLGTGFIIDASGLILTNNHVVAEADEIKINFTELEEEKATDGEVVGRDPELDIALIKVKTKRELVPVVLGDSDKVEVGEYVIAVGNPFGQGHSVTHGIISAKGRLAPDFPLTNYLQTDAPINPGNSGGPLVNLKGEVVGINNAIDQRAQNIGFAIPINVVKKILPQLRTSGSVTRGYIGVLVNEMSPELAQQLGAPSETIAPFVTHVYPGSPAEQAGLKPYDIVLSFNGAKIHSPNDLIMQVTGVAVGQSAPVKILRAGKEKELTLKVAARPNTQTLADRAKKGKSEKKKDKKQARLETGMNLDDLSPEIAKDLGLSEKATGAVVTSVAFGSPADKSGLLRGDLILEADRKSVKDVDGFYSIVKDKKSYLLRIRRQDAQGRESFAVVILDLKP